MRMLIADDHALLREGFVGFLQAAHGTWDIKQTATLEETQNCLAQQATDLLSIDLQMPGMDGVGSLSALRSDYPSMKMVVLTATDDRQSILECLGAGVNGYIPKSVSTDELLAAVNTVVAGGMYVPATLSRVPAAGPVRELAAMGASAPAALTPRQQDVMLLLAEGMSTKMIARRLSLGVGTVKVHLAALYRALDVHTRMEAVVKSGTLVRTD